MEKPNVSGNVQSVGKALSLLDMLLKKRAPMELKELSERSGYPKSTVHALLSTMREYSIVKQNEDGKYALGTHLFELGCAVSSSWNITGIVHPYLEKLALESQASSFIALLDGNCGMTFDLCACPNGLQVVSELGARLPLHATCQGKMLLSGLSDDDIKFRLSGTELEKLTEKTITDIDQFLIHMETIRKLGYAVEDCEYKNSIRAVAAPVFDRTNKLRYALGVVGLFPSVFCEDFRKAISLTVDYASQISQLFRLEN